MLIFFSEFINNLSLMIISLIILIVISVPNILMILEDEDYKNRYMSLQGAMSRHEAEMMMKNSRNHINCLHNRLKVLALQKQ